jgi:hypothetical protein
MSETSQLPSLADFAEAEHCVLEDVTVQQEALPEALAGSGREPREQTEVVVIADKLRGRQTTVRLYAEGWVDIQIDRRGRPANHHRIDLRYLDAVPETSRHHPVRLLKATGILAGLTGLFVLPAVFGWLASVTVPAAIVGAIATIATAFAAFCLSHETIVFRTLHGRADAIRFFAGLGTIRRFRRLLPKLTDAIADSVESLHGETAVYLRAEMREHYRLRHAGILSDEACAASTGRILSEFDGPL